MFVFSIFTFLVFGHQYNNSCSYNKQSLMSKSTRQIAHPKEFQRDASSFSNFPHKRGLSIEMRNFAQLLLKGKEHYKNNRMAEAIQVFTRGLYYDSNNLELNYWLGVSLMNVGNYSESLKYLKHVEKTNRLYRPNLLIMLAIGYKKMGHIQQSLSAVTEYITINENGCKDGLFYRAKIYKEMKDYGRVLDDLDAILIQNPQHTASMLLKVRILIEKESEDQALSLLKVCKQRIHEPDKIQELYFEQIKINAKRGLFQESFQLMNKLQRLVPNPMPQCSLLKAKLHEKCGRKQEALMLYNELLAKNSSAKVFSEAIAQCAIICMRERDFYEALSYLKRTLLTKIKSKVTDQLFKLGQGLTFLMKKKYAEAIVLMGSCEINFKYELAQHVPYLQNLLSNALAYGNFSLGNHEAALQFYQKIMQNEPNTDSVAASYNICICEGIRAYQNGERDLALECFEKASNYILRPEPFFYTAVIMNEEFLKQPINTQGFVKILQLIEQGLKTGQNAHLFFYRATLYLFLGMHSQSLEDIDRAIEKSEDNVAKYFYTRGVIFMLDKNYEQAILQFTTAISIDDADQASITQKAKCELLTGDTEDAFTNIRDLSRYSQLRTLFMLHEKQYRQIIGNQNVSETILQICRFMEGKFEEAGPSGKLVLAILYQNYAEVINLIDEAVTLGVPVGCLESNDLLILKAFSEYRLNRYEQSLLTLQRVQQALKQSNNRCDTYSQQDERKLLLCRFNVIITNFKRDHQLEALSLTESLLCQVCEGPIFDQLTLLKQYLTQGGQHQVDFGFDSALLSDFFGFEEQKGLRFKFLIPLPNYKVTQVQIPPYQQLLTHFSVADIENRPQAPWIKRGEFGVIFTNDIREFQNLNLKTEQNQAVKSRLPTGEQSKNLVRKRSQLIEYLKLSATILNKLDRITKKVDNVESS